MSPNVKRLKFVWAATGAFFVALGIAVGAVGVHVLESRGMVEGAGRWDLAGQYAVLMGLGLIALTSLRLAKEGLGRAWPEVCLVLGVLGFSGGLLWKGIFPESIVGQVIPVGGVILIVGWMWAGIQIIALARLSPS
jgi:uncharacterized membrane protein YgdD (TMEM256/DUF423 family)